jgi:hypothetical protein
MLWQEVRLKQIRDFIHDRLVSPGKGVKDTKSIDSQAVNVV